MIEAVVFDLDDTLYLQHLWLARVWRAVADEGHAHGVDADRLHAELVWISSHGSDRGGIIDRAVAAVGGAASTIPALVEVFRSFEAPPLPLAAGAEEALRWAAALGPIGLLTDGDPRTQRQKIRALGLSDRFDSIVITDEAVGRSRRKPHPAGLALLCARLRVPPRRVLVVGDRPAKDVAVARAVGARSVRVRTGEHRHAPDTPAADLIIDDLTALESLTPSLLAAADPAGGR